MALRGSKHVVLLNKIIYLCLGNYETLCIDLKGKAVPLQAWSGPECSFIVKLKQSR
jgi:hypothetical protein